MNHRRRLFLATIGLLTLLVALSASRAARAEVPDDGHVIWQSLRNDAHADVYRIRANGTELIRLTTAGAFQPMWSPDGRWIVYHDELGGVFLMRPDGSGQHNVATSGWAVAWLHDNSGLLLGTGGEYFVLDPETGAKTPLFKPSDFPQFATTTFQPNAMTHDNRYLLLGSHLYQNGFSGSNGSFTSAFSAVMVDMLHKDRTYFIGNGCWPFSPPQGDLVFHICNDCPTHPDIYRMSVADLATRSSYQPEEAHPDPDWGHEYNPRVSNDNKWVSYMSSTGCHDGLDCDYEIFIHQLGAGSTERTRITNHPAFDGYPDIHVGPLWSPQAPPALFLRPNRVTFFASAAALPEARTLKVRNDGAASLSNVKATVEPAVPWLDLTINDTSLVLQLKGGAVTRGRHTATVTVRADGLGPVTVPVVLDADETFPTADASADATADSAVAEDAAGRVDAGTDAAAITRDAATVSDGASDATNSPSTSDDGCGCSLGATPRHRSGVLVLVAFVLIVRLRGRRRQRTVIPSGDESRFTPPFRDRVQNPSGP